MLIIRNKKVTITHNTEQGPLEWCDRISCNKYCDCQALGLSNKNAELKIEHE